MFLCLFKKPLLVPCFHSLFAPISCGKPERKADALAGVMSAMFLPEERRGPYLIILFTASTTSGPTAFFTAAAAFLMAMSFMDVMAWR